MVCPVLPSRDADINARINQFNKYLFTDLAQCNTNVNIVHGFSEFCDREGLLKSALHDRRTDSDVLHINGGGYRILVRIIKNCIFRNKRSKNRFTTDRLFSNVVRGGPPGPLR